MNGSILLWVQWCFIKIYYIVSGLQILLILSRASYSSSLFLVPGTSQSSVFIIIFSFRMCARKKKFDSFWIQICFPCIYWSSQNYQPCIHSHGLPHSAASIPGNHFSANEVWQRARSYWSHWSYHVVYHPKAAGLVEQWNGPLKTQSQQQLDGSISWGWGKAPQEAVCALTQGLIHSAFLL